jgi:hypothetical protein
MIGLSEALPAPTDSDADANAGASSSSPEAPVKGPEFHLINI